MPRKVVNPKDILDDVNPKGILDDVNPKDTLDDVNPKDILDHFYLERVCVRHRVFKGFR
jgi:hypothetical protein